MKKIRKQAILIIFTLALTLIMCSAVSAADNDTIYVNDTGGNDANNGTSWEFAKKTIKNATGTINPNGMINIANGFYSGSDNSGIEIDRNMTIIGQSQSGTKIDGDHYDQIFYVLAEYRLTLKYLTLRDGEAEDGGAIYNKGTLIVDKCTFTSNEAEDGGAIFNRGTATITGSTFTYNDADNEDDYGHGGAIYNIGKITITSCTFTENEADEAGGAIFNIDKYADLSISDLGMANDCTITSCTFNNNNAEEGGAISNCGTCTVNKCIFTNNRAKSNTNLDSFNLGKGGAIFTAAGAATITGSTFTGNNAYNGGAIYACCGNATINGCNLTGNSATNGGAIFRDDANLKLKYNTIANNKVVLNSLPIPPREYASINVNEGYGGGIFLIPFASFEIIGNHILNNIGSGIYIGFPYMSLPNSISKVPEEVKKEIKWIINFNRIYGNTPYGIYNNTTNPTTTAFIEPDKPKPVLNAKYNWWGKNSGPNTPGADKTNLASTYYDPWIIMKLNPAQAVFTGGETTALTVNFLYDNRGGYHDPKYGHIPDGTPVLFTTTLGQVGSQSIIKYTVNGVATAILKGWDEYGNPVSGIAYITATTDGQTLSSSVTVEAANTVGMLKTGLPIAGLILAIFAILGGSLVPRRK